MVTFPTITSFMVKKFQICISFLSSSRKQCLPVCYLLFYMVETTFSNLLNYTDFVHKISHIKPSKYDSTFGTQISICLKKSLGMRGRGDEVVDRNKHF